MTYALSEADARLELRHVRESAGELSGELSVAVQRRPISVARFNLSSLTARRTHVKYLNEIDPATPWQRLLEGFAQQVLAIHRRGEEVVMLNGTEPAGTRPPTPVLPPLLWDREPTILFGEGGIRKSTFAAAVAVSVQSGREVVPGLRPRSGPVLILDWEDDGSTWQERMHAFTLGAGAAPGQVAYQRQTLPLHRRAEELSAYVAANGIALVVIDSVGMATGSGHEGGSAEETVIRLFDALRQMDCSKLLIDHVTKSEVGQNKRVGPYGSVFKINLARNVFELCGELEPAGSTVELVLRHTKTNRGAKHPPMGFRLHYGETFYRIETAEVEAEELQAARSWAQRMRALLAGGAMSVPELMEALGTSQGVIRMTAKRHPEQFIRLDGGLLGLKS